MKYSEGSLLRQYERAFRAYGIEISFEDEALRLLAEAAAMEKTGARGLLTVFEKLFRDYKYYLAGSGLTQLRVTADLVREPQRVLDRLKVEGHKLEAQMLEVGARHATKFMAGLEAAVARPVTDYASATTVVGEKWQYVFVLLIAIGVAWLRLSNIPRRHSRLLIGLLLIELVGLSWVCSLYKI